MKISYVNFVFISLFIVFSSSRKLKSKDKTYRKFASFFLAAPKGKNIGTLNFKMKNSTLFFNFGLVRSKLILSAKGQEAFSVSRRKSTFKGRKLITSSLESQGQVYFNQTSQWRLIHQDEFSKNDTNYGWNFDKITKCNDKVLFGGECLLSNFEIKKEFTLPLHSQVKIEALFHFIGKWKGNTAYLKEVNEKSQNYLWTSTCLNKEKPSLIKFCEFETCRMNQGISVSAYHKDKNITLSFGSDLPHNACEGSYAISSFRLYIR